MCKTTGENPRRAIPPEHGKALNAAANNSFIF
jgi:hypothetical protein